MAFSLASGGRSMTDEQSRPSVYLAGPDVFFPEVAEHAAGLKAALAARGMIGLFPFDSALEPAQFPDRKTFGLAIGRGNEGLMRRADIIMANIQPWRGVEADDGTSYEIGFMAALGKLIVLYTNDPRPFAERIIDDVYGGDLYQDGPDRRGTRDRMLIEEFDGFADNLMLINAAVTSAERALGRPVDPAVIVHPGFATAADYARMLWDASAASRS
jgi:nucleoside 2-deoxyribosyltransferase